MAIDMLVIVGVILGITAVMDWCNHTILKQRIQAMSTAFDALKAQVEAIDARDDQIVALVDDLTKQVQALADMLATRPADAELQALADTLADTVSKFDAVLTPPPPPAT